MRRASLAARRGKRPPLTSRNNVCVNNATAIPGGGWSVRGQEGCYRERIPQPLHPGPRPAPVALVVVNTRVTPLRGPLTHLSVIHDLLLHISFHSELSVIGSSFMNSISCECSFFIRKGFLVLLSVTLSMAPHLLRLIPDLSVMAYLLDVGCLVWVFTR